jgi:hypothetical protein
MALEGKSIGLFTWLDEAGVEHTLSADVVSNGVDERTAQLSDHSVETGSVITDHVVILPETLSLELVVSNTPITEVAGFGRSNLALDVRPSQFKPGGFLFVSSGVRSAIAGLVSRPEPPVAVNTLQPTGGTVDRVADVHDQLIRILQGALLVTVSFKGRVYADYLLTRVTLTSNSGEFGLGRFGVDARAFRTVTGETVQLPDPADFRALPSKGAGNKGKKAPSPEPKESIKSLAAGLVDGDLF